MAARDKRRTDIAKFLDAMKSMHVPNGLPEQQAIWVILARHGTKDGATRAGNLLWDHFVSVNEFRVAKVTEIADMIEPFVKNDAMVVAEQARGFLREFFKEHQMVALSAADERPAHELKRYLGTLGAYGREVALALALHHCQRELRAQAEEHSDADGKPKKRPEKELTASANKLRLTFTFSAHGTPTSKEAHSGRAFVRAWAYKALPAASRKKAARKKAAAPKKVARKTVATKKKAAGKARPKTIRTARKRSTTKKSSRR